VTPLNATLQSLRTNRRRSARRRSALIALMLAVVVALFLLTLLLGQSFTPPQDIFWYLLGEPVRGVAFTVGQLRLPRAILSVLAGASFGLGGVAFQTMLRNPLASPDIIGISYAASGAAVFAIVVLSLKGPVVSVLAVAAALSTALLVYALSFRNGVAGARLILVGIGVSAMLESIISYILSGASAWNLQEAMRWLTGSVNGVPLDQTLPLLAAFITFGGLLLIHGRDLETLRLGDDKAAALGVSVTRLRMIVIVSAVGMISFATAVAGPIAFVAFLSGPIASRLVKSGGSLLVPSTLVGAILVLAGDYCGQFLFPSRYPVGVVTGALGAPYLIYLIIRVNRSGGAP
jgi:iron complex transport system permease protein